MAWGGFLGAHRLFVFSFLVVIQLLCGLALSPVWAGTPATEPTRGPVPSWVVPQEIPRVPMKPTDLPATILLMDQQMRLEGGTLFSYVEIVIHINDERGLSNGTQNVQWDPSSSTLSIHKFEILRDGKAIDALAGEQAITVLRREPNLAQTMLDGELTANLIAPGVQVGDTVHLAFTHAQTDPLVPGRVEIVGPQWRYQPLERGHLRIDWPTDHPLQVAVTDDFGRLVRKTAKGRSSVEMTITEANPPPPPADGPPRYFFRRLFQASSFPSWAAVAASQRPLYEKASRLAPDSPLWEEINRIKAISPDPIVRTEAALNLVQRQVRYVALAMGVGGYVPADVDTTWQRRFGDCKAKTVLLLALLRELGVDAEPVMVNGDLGDGLDQRLPMLSWFNHVLLRATIGGQVYWLDGTRPNDNHLAQLPVPGFRWGLPLRAGEASGLIPIEPPPLAEPDHVFSVTLHAEAGLEKPIPVTAEDVFRGDKALGLNSQITRQTERGREQYFHKYWRGIFSSAEFDKFDSTFDAEKGELRLIMQGTMTMRWRNDRYQISGLVLPPLGRPDRPSGDRDAPVGIVHPTYWVTRVNVRLPSDADTFTLANAEPVARTLGAHEYRLAVSMDDHVVHAESSIRSLAFETGYDDVIAAMEWLEGRSVPEIVRQPVKKAEGPGQ